MLEQFQMYQSKPSTTPADLNLKIQTAWITSVSGQTDKARHHVLSQHSVRTHEYTYQSTLAMRKTTSAISSKFERFKTQKKPVMTYWSKVMQTGLVVKLQKIIDGLLIQAWWTWRSTQLGCQEAGHSCLFFIRSRISGHGSSNSRSIVS